MYKMNESIDHERNYFNGKNLNLDLKIGFYPNKVLSLKQTRN